MTPPSGTEAGTLDTVPAAHMVTDLAGHVISANRLLRSWCGDADNIESATIRDFLTASSCLYFESVITPMLSLEGELSDVALELDGSAGVRHTLWAARRDGADTVHWVGLDVTARRLHERQLIAVQRRLARLQRLSADLLKVNTVESMSDVLLSHLVDGVKADRGLVAIQGDENGLRLAAGQALGTARPDAAELEEEPLARRALEQGQPIFSTVRPTVHDDEFDEVTQTAAISMAGERRLGVVLLKLERETPHSDEEKEFLVAAVDIASSSIERAQLLGRLETVAHLNASLSALLHAMEAETSVRDRAQRIADLVVPDLCDLAVVALDELSSDAVGLRSADPSVEETVRWLHRRLGSSGEPSAPLSGGPVRLPTTHATMSDRELRAAGLDENEVAAVRSLNVGMFLRLPLVARSRTIGMLSLGFEAADDPRARGAEEFLGRLADACALSLDNARLYEHERGIAQQLQAALLPERLPADRRFSLNYFYQAGRDALHVGGDWYDAFLLDSDRLGIMVGDVVGGGVAAARTMGTLRSVAFAFAQDGRGVAGTLAALHRFADTPRHGFGSSVVYAELDLLTGTMQYSSAGHPLAIILTPEAGPVLASGGRGVLLGLQKGQPPVATTTLSVGSTVVMYTDGLIERPGRTITDSVDDLVKVLRDRPGLVDSPELLAHTLDIDASPDDTCILTTRLTEPTAPGAVG